MSEREEHHWAVDGIEEGIARIEEDGERMLAVPRYLLPNGAREGQLLRVTRAPGAAGVVAITVEIDAAATKAALAKSKATTTRAAAASRKRDPGGDVAL